MFRKSLIALSLAMIAAAPLAAQESRAPVDCGSVTCFVFRVAAEGKAPDARAGFAMDIINKYLGGKVGKVTTKSAGKNVKLFLNNDFVAVVTPADAASEKQKSAVELAKRWAAKLSRAFEETKAQK